MKLSIFSNVTATASWLSSTRPASVPAHPRQFVSGCGRRSGTLGKAEFRGHSRPVTDHLRAGRPGMVRGWPKMGRADVALSWGAFARSGISRPQGERYLRETRSENVAQLQIRNWTRCRGRPSDRCEPHWTDDLRVVRRGGSPFLGPPPM